MRGKGINYDTGFMPGNHSRPGFDPALVAAEIRVIARELSLLPEGPGSGYQGLGWRPRLAFETMAALPVG
jgi:hypothetical protein